jgi:hypothetical protein
MALILILGPDPVLNPTDVYTLVAPSIETLTQRCVEGSWRCYQGDRLVLIGHDLKDPGSHRAAVDGQFTGEWAKQSDEPSLLIPLPAIARHN